MFVYVVLVTKVKITSALSEYTIPPRHRKIQNTLRGIGLLVHHKRCNFRDSSHPDIVCRYRLSSRAKRGILVSACSAPAKDAPPFRSLKGGMPLLLTLVLSEPLLLPSRVHRFVYSRVTRQFCRLIRRFPRKIRIVAAEMSVRRRLLIDRPAQFQRIDNAPRRQLKVRTNQIRDDGG